jgi:YidC/Oxa1 family membrane protein insertase
VLVVLIVLYVGSQLASTLIATATADPNQRRMMLILPIVFVVILYRYPAGLLVYWITTNLWTVGQQFLIRRRLPPPARPTGTTNGKPSRSIRQAIADAAGGAAAGAAAQPQPEPAGAGGSGLSTGAPPPRSPRKKKKRSGRRR